MIRTPKGDVEQGLDPRIVEDAVRKAEADSGVHNLHAEPRGNVWEILGDVESADQREMIFDTIRERLGERNVVNALHVIEPKNGDAE